MFKIRQVYKKKTNVVAPQPLTQSQQVEDDLDVEFIVDDETGDIIERKKEVGTTTVKLQPNQQVIPRKASSTHVHSSMKRVTESSFM